MRHLRFAKMHGSGNDFMLVDLVTQGAQPSPERIRAWGDRRTGIGFDQFLAVLPPDDPAADFRYRIFNADGSEAEQCGNGARCVARFAVDAQLTAKRALLLQSAAGDVEAVLHDGGRVTVDMGVPATDPAAIPFVADAAANGAAADAPLAYPVELPGGALDVTPVSLGNPHAVIFVDDAAAADVAGIGAALQHHARFPERANGIFLEVTGCATGRLRVYERGVGETRACGSGACAAMVAGRLHGRFGDCATLALPGGELTLAWPGRGASVKLTGPTEHVYSGRVPL